MEKSREAELTRISRELIYLQANLKKKQKKVETVMREKDQELERKDLEIEGLKRRIDDLSSSSTTLAAVIPLPPSPGGLETPGTTSSSSSSSGEDEDQQPSPSRRVPKFSIRPKKSPGKFVLPPPLPPPKVSTRYRRRLNNNNSGNWNNSGSWNAADDAFIGTPRKCNDCTLVDVHDAETDETSSLITNDEGFSSCQDEPVIPKSFETFVAENGITFTPSVAVSNRHRTVMKPSDVKSRSRLNREFVSAGKEDITVVEEHEVSVVSETGKVKSITRWTGPFV